MVRDGLIVSSGRFLISRKVGCGSFGEVFAGTNVQTGKAVAIKVELTTARSQCLLAEAKLCKALAGAVGVPYVHWYGVEADCNIMVMDLLGPSLEEMFCICRRIFGLKTVLMLADQILDRMEYLHAKNVVHRDVKPENLLLGLGRKCDQVQIIDFGLATRYKDLTTLEHVPCRQIGRLVGTARYASVSSHMGMELSRRDDLESVGYILVYFLRGSLPWQGIRAGEKQDRYDAIKDKKITLPVEVLCQGVPQEFVIYIRYCRGLAFDERPDYSYLRALFKDLFKTQSYSWDCNFDWKSCHDAEWSSSAWRPEGSANARQSTCTEEEHLYKDLVAPSPQKAISKAWLAEAAAQVNPPWWLTAQAAF